MNGRNILAMSAEPSFFHNIMSFIESIYNILFILLTPNFFADWMFFCLIYRLYCMLFLRKKKGMFSKV